MLFRAADSSEAKDGRRELDALTHETGGAVAYPGSVEDIPTVAIDLARQIRSQYTIGYMLSTKRSMAPIGASTSKPAAVNR